VEKRLKRLVRLRNGPENYVKEDMKGLLSPWKGGKKAQKVSRAEERSRVQKVY
jgi:hypothetical protein